VSAEAPRRPGFSHRRRVGLSACLGLTGLLLAVASMGLAPSFSFAEDQTWGYALAHELMSPYCPGRTLAACTSDQAAELRQWILLQEAAGASQEEVVGVLEQRFGDVIRSSPEAEGWGLAAWLLPGAVLLVGALAVVGVLRRMVAKPKGPVPSVSLPGSPSAPSDPAAGGASEAADDEIARLVDQEIAAGER
jgi:cytochrome c-type biogenesis protein CcmH/NrfF